MMIAARRLPRTIYRPGVWSPVSPMHHFFSTGENSKRIAGIHVNPDSIVSQILPGGRAVLKKDRKGEYREIMVERAFGHFWMIQDLTKVGNKPILSSEIPEEEAQDFPTLMNCSVLKTNESVDVPAYFVRDNRANDASAQCTLVAIAYKDYGFKLLPSWTEPFEAAFGVGNERAKAMRISVTEGKFTKMLLSGFMKRSFRASTPPELQSQTLLCFGPDEARLREFNDTLRMHNTLTGYVFLLDGLGRVRFAGSGEGSDKEVNRMIQYAKELTPRLSSSSPSTTVRKTKRSC